MSSEEWQKITEDMFKAFNQPRSFMQTIETQYETEYTGIWKTLAAILIKVTSIEGQNHVLLEKMREIKAIVDAKETTQAKETTNKTQRTKHKKKV